MLSHSRIREATACWCPAAHLWRTVLRHARRRTRNVVGELRTRAAIHFLVAHRRTPSERFVVDTCPHRRSVPTIEARGRRHV